MTNAGYEADRVHRVSVRKCLKPSRYLRMLMYVLCAKRN